MNYGFVRVGAAVPKLKVADCVYNADKIIDLIYKADDEGVQFIVFPELSLTAYTCADLFHHQTLLSGAETMLGKILEKTLNSNMVTVVGMPLCIGSQIFNCGVAMQNGKILGITPKSYTASSIGLGRIDWFASGLRAVGASITVCGQSVPFGTDLLFESNEDPRLCFGIEIGDDLWSPLPPSSYQAIAGATLILNLSASNEIAGKCEYRRDLVTQQSGKCLAGYVYASCGVYESTTDVVFGGHAMLAENGTILAETKRFIRKGQLLRSDIDIEKLINYRLANASFAVALQNEGLFQADSRFRRILFDLKHTDLNQLCRNIPPHPFVPSDPGLRSKRCSEIFSIQTAGLAKRLAHTCFANAVIGVSGGLDSTLALLVTAKTFDMLGIPRQKIIAVTMPGFGTSDETYKNAIKLMENIGVSMREIDIKEACLQHFKDIGHSPEVYDTTYENVQARERTQILMDLANKMNGLVIGTGDLSEMALGWCTYNGDHMSMYAVNCGIPKTLMKYLVRWVAEHIEDHAVAEVLLSIISTPISPELLPTDSKGGISQKTEDIIGPYELHDFFMYHMLRYGAYPSKILFLALQAYKDAYSAETIKKWLRVFYRRFFSQQFKRTCQPDGPRVGTISLSPRGGWNMPSDAEAAVWLRDLES